MRTLLLYTRDLRVHDHPALYAAWQGSDDVVPLFVLDPRFVGTRPNRERFLLECLVDLDRSLTSLGGRLFVRQGSVVEQTMAFATSSGCSAVFIGGDVGAYARRRERELETECARAGIAFRRFPENAVVEPGGLARRRAAYRVFTPYLRAWSERPRRRIVPIPPRLAVPPDLEPGPRPEPTSVSADALDRPRGGERPGRRRLHAFLGRELGGYTDARDDLAAEATSRLSPYLRFGCLSASEVATRAGSVPGSDAFVRQLAWRDFFLQLLADDPRLAWRSLRDPVGVAHPPVGPEDAFEAWREGCTGLPLVDAGMRQLRREGWMHNRARLVTASFLTRRLGIPWQEGARHFARLLLDADPANNAGNWQWVAGTGVDPRRTRTLNPVRQAKRFDPSGDYVRRYVPELAGLQTSFVFAPWKDPALLRRTGYPAPIVDVPG